MKEITKIFIPEKLEILLYILAGFILILVADYKLFLSYLSGAAKTYSADAGEIITKSFVNKVASFERIIDPRIVDFVVWTILGIIIIGIVLVIEGLIVSAKNEKNIVNYLNNPQTKSNELKAYAIKMSIRFGSGLALLIFSRLFVVSIFPSLALSFYTSAVDINKIESIAIMLFCPMIVGVCLYVIAVLLRLILLRPRVFGEY